MKLIMENFNKFLEEAENEGGKKPVITYTVYGNESDDEYAEYEYEFDVIKNKDKLKDEHKIDPETYINPIQLVNMVKKLSNLTEKEEEKLKQKKLELKFAIDFDGLRVNVAPTLKKSLKEGTTLKDVTDMWAKLYGYKIEHPDSANGSEKSDEDEV